MPEIIPAIMPQSVRDLEDKLALVAKLVPLVQLDIMDGKFVRPKTWPYMNDRGDFENLVSESEGMPFWDQVDFEIDLMVAHPEHVIEEWIAVGAKRLIVHVESTPVLDEIVNIFRQRFAYPPDKREREVEFILALNIDTPIDTILPYLEDIDGVQFMGIAHIGYQGEPFDERVLSKIQDFHNAHPEVIISVDGGVNEETIPELLHVGVTRLVSGSAIFESENSAETIEYFKSL